jgi:NAD(P)-dependent dehydrogenase (short-subunit alcohol dehydrogenase family)
MNLVEPIDSYITVITGASSGLGSATAHRLALEGRRILTLQRRPPEFVMNDGYKYPIEFLEVDLYDLKAVEQVAEEIIKKDQVGYLVNNAGINRPGSIEDVTEDDLNTVWQLNIQAPIKLIQGFLPQMKKNQFGRIVNISSRAILGKTERIAYVSSKMGVVGLTLSLALEVAPYGITVNAVAPGPVETELFSRGHPVGSQRRSFVIESIPVKRLGTPEDVARSVSFFLSPENGFITGQLLYVCGGLSVSGSGGL